MEDCSATPPVAAAYQLNVGVVNPFGSDTLAAGTPAPHCVEEVVEGAVGKGLVVTNTPFDTNGQLLTVAVPVYVVVLGTEVDKGLVVPTTVDPSDQEYAVGLGGTLPDNLISNLVVVAVGEAVDLPLVFECKTIFEAVLV